MSIRPLLALSTALLLFGTLRLAAQTEQADTTRLDTVVVHATRDAAPLARVPYAVSVVTPAPFTPGISLEDALEAAPGVQVDNRYNYAVGDRIAVRGVGARSQFGVRGVKVIVDGVPATFADGQTALEGVEPRFIERAEIIRGAASMLYGNAAGGAIVMSTAARSSRAGVTVAGDGGPASYYARVARTIGPLSARYLFSHIDYAGWREHSDASVWRHALIGDIGVSPRDSLTLRFALSSVDALNPGSLSRETADLTPHAAHVANVQQGTSKKAEQVEIGGEHRTRIGGLDARLGAWFITRDVDNPIIGRRILLDRSATGIRFVAGHAFLDDRLRISVGADVDAQFDDRRNVTGSGHLTEVLLDQSESVVSYGPFVLAAADLLPTLRITGALRLDAVRFAVTDRLIDTANPDDSGERSMSAMSPSLGVAWMPLGEITLFANVATGFETPTTTELANRPDGAGGFNPELEPQRSLSFEAGVRAATSILSCEAVAYHMTVEEELIPFEVASAPGREYFRNAGSAVHRGLELSARVTPVSGLSLHASAAYTDARFRSFAVDGVELDGNRIPGVAPLQISAGARLQLAGVTLAADARHQSETSVDDANTSVSSAYTIVNARAGYAGLTFDAAGESIAVVPHVGIENAFDVRYAGSIVPNAAGGRYFEPGRGRTVYAGIELWVE